MANSADNNGVNKPQNDFRLNDELCYITTARDSLSKDTVLMNVVAYYTGEAIFAAKEEIFIIFSAPSGER